MLKFLRLIDLLSLFASKCIDKPKYAKLGARLEHYANGLLLEREQVLFDLKVYLLLLDQILRINPDGAASRQENFEVAAISGGHQVLYTRLRAFIDALILKLKLSDELQLPQVRSTFDRVQLSIVMNSNERFAGAEHHMRPYDIYEHLVVFHRFLKLKQL